MGKVIASRTLAALYWTLWYALVPLCIVRGAFALAQPRGADLLSQWLRDQPIPCAIALYLLVTSAFSVVRYQLPLAAYAYRPKLGNVPLTMAPLFDRASSLLEEFQGMHKKRARLIELTSEQEVNEVDESVAKLRSAIAQQPFRPEALVFSFGEAEMLFARVYGRFRKGDLRATLEVILPIVVMLLVFRGSVGELFKIPSGSMVPTLQIGDHIFVNKLKYGPTVPFTQIRLWENFPPARGDVAVFAYPEEPEKDFIKRVIGLAGDTIEVKGGHPWLNGWEVPSCLIGPYKGADSDGDLYVEYLGKEAYFVLNAIGDGTGDQGPFSVAKNEAFVLGDNRNNSHDSRFWWDGKGGGVPFANFRGPASLIWFSYAGTHMDGSRIGRSVMTSQLSLPKGMGASSQSALDKCLRDRPATTVPPLSTK